MLYTGMADYGGLCKSMYTIRKPQNTIIPVCKRKHEIVLILPLLLYSSATFAF